MDLYFVVSGRTSVETEAIKEVKPDRLLCSYFYFRTRNLSDYLEQLEYKPKILLDSGAYSAWTTGRNISIIDYMDYIKNNIEHIEHYIALDVFNDPELTLDFYRIMRKKGLEPVPVYHYCTDETYLQQYIADGNEYIALGGTMPATEKSLVAKWVNYLTHKYQGIKFHLLGSNSALITLFTDLHSCDSSTWIMAAVTGKPKHILGKSREKKVERAKWNLRDMQERARLKQLKIV